MSIETSGLHEILGFSYRVLRPENTSADTMILLHGSGVDETTLAPLARTVSPQATLVAVRGRIRQEDGWRWFERITPTRFDQDSIRSESTAFADFIARLPESEGINLTRTTFLGYSNGANLISSTMLLHPGLIDRAVLLRAMPVLDEVPATDLMGTRILVVAGAADATYGPSMPAIVGLLRRHGAAVEARNVTLGHEFGDADASLIERWLASSATAAS